MKIHIEDLQAAVSECYKELFKDYCRACRERTVEQKEEAYRSFCSNVNSLLECAERAESQDA